MQKKKAVSLIVLVITIIVMIILAGVIILSLNNSGIIDKAQNAVDKTNLNEVKNLAQLAWAEAYLNTGRTQEELETAVMNALEANKITEEHYKGYTIEVTTQGVNFVEEVEIDPALNHSGIIPEGATYTTGLVPYDDMPGWDESNAITYTAGEAFPEPPVTGDRYIYGDYVYRYNASYHQAYEDFGMYESQNGWGARVRDMYKTSYEPLLESINNKPLTSMQFTFCYARDMVTAPTIPSSVVNIYFIFEECVSLTGEIIIDANPTNYTSWLGSSEPIVLTGTSTMLEELASGYENVTVK